MSRFELEHIKLPRMFYDDCPGLVGAMEKEGGQHGPHPVPRRGYGRADG